MSIKITCSRCKKDFIVHSKKKRFRKNGKLACIKYKDINGFSVVNNICFNCAQKKRFAARDKRRLNKIKKIRRFEMPENTTLLKEIVCRSCKKTIPIKFIKTYTEKSGKHEFLVPVYMDLSANKLIYRSLCYSCNLTKIRKRNKSTSREESKKKQTVLAVASEKIAQKRFEDLGFKVKRVDFFGPDLVCTMGQLKFNVEVKRATLSSRSWRTGVIRPLRKHDDLVAIVLPNKYVYIDSMSNHLNFCTKHGQRSVTSIVKQFGLN